MIKIWWKLSFYKSWNHSKIKPLDRQKNFITEPAKMQILEQNQMQIFIVDVISPWKATFKKNVKCWSSMYNGNSYKHIVGWNYAFVCQGFQRWVANYVFKALATYVIWRPHSQTKYTHTHTHTQAPNDSEWHIKSDFNFLVHSKSFNSCVGSRTPDHHSSLDDKNNILSFAM